MTQSEEIYGLRDIITEMHNDIKTLLSSNAATEERLKNGVGHFAKIDEEQKEQNKKIGEIEKRQCPKFPKPSLVYTLIILGFTALGLIIELK